MCERSESRPPSNPPTGARGCEKTPTTGASYGTVTSESFRRVNRPASLRENDSADPEALCLQAINELGPDVAEQIIAGYEEAKAPAARNDKFTSAL